MVQKQNKRTVMTLYLYTECDWNSTELSGQGLSWIYMQNSTKRPNFIQETDKTRLNLT